MTTDRGLPPLGSRLGNYRLTRVLGQGRMGTVFLAVDERLQRPTALKVLSLLDSLGPSHDPWSMFIAEARVVANLIHPNIIQVYNMGAEEGWAYIAMEFVDGPSADQWVRRDGPLPVQQATDVLLQVSMALSAAHVHNVIHRDVKPANVMIGQDATVKLGDFGLALNRAEESIPVVGARVGTPFFTAPELWCYWPATPAADIYSLGATYFYLLTGRHPFPDGNEEVLRKAHLEAPPPDPRDFYPEIPDRAAEIVKCCMAKLPEGRYPSARELGWAARGLLCAAERTNSWLVVTGSEQDEESSPPSFQPAMRTWASLGFVHQPFSDVDPRCCPYTGEPFRGIADAIGERVRQPGTATVLLGNAGSGRTMLCRQQEALLRRSQFVLYLALRRYRGPRTLEERLIRAAGAPLDGTAATGSSFDRLIETLTVRYRAYERPSLLILDGLTHTPQEESCLRALIRSARMTGLFSLLLVDEAAPWHRGRVGVEGDNEAVLSLVVPPLTAMQTIEYVRAWINVALGPKAAPLLVPPDAALLLWHASAGNLTRLNGMASNMLVLASQQKRRVIMSTTAWAAAGQRRFLVAPEDVRWDVLQSIERGPDTELLGIIASCRRQAGLAARTAQGPVSAGRDSIQADEELVPASSSAEPRGAPR